MVDTAAMSTAPPIDAPAEVLDEVGEDGDMNDESEVEAREVEEEGGAHVDGDDANNDADDAPEVPNAFEIDYGKDGAPKRYQMNVPEEVEVLAYITNFQRQFHQLYPQRKPLFICPPNEYGVPKFIPSTLRPTQLPYKELLDHTTCAAFVADFVSYEPLENQTSFPDMLQSPTTTLALNSGNSFDFSILLCSLLLGAGYDAYVVVGYGAKDVTLGTEGREECPLLQAQPEERVPEVVAPERKYKIRSRESMESTFMKKMQERDVQRKADAAQKERELAEQNRKEENRKWLKDTLHGLRIHAWVLVRAGKRTVPESFFIEPTTGKACAVTNCSYLGVESIFNDQNYWVNMQDCTNGTVSMSFDISNPAKFEYVIYKQPLEGKNVAQVDDAVTDAVAEQDFGTAITLPPSWVMRLHITEDQFRKRRPNGQKITNFKGCKLEQYSAYTKDDGLVMRITIYDDQTENKGVTEVREVYANRKDKLCERHYYPRTGKTHEWFVEGRIHSLKEHIFFDQLMGKTVIMKFYSGARVDGLVERVDTGATLTETYGPRHDGITFLQAEFAEHTIVDGRRKILRMKRKFARNCGRETRTGVIEEEFFDVDNEIIKITHHLVDGAIAASTREYSKSQSANVKARKKVSFKVAEFNADPTAAKLAHHYCEEEKELLDKRQEQFRVCVRDIEREMAQMLEVREREKGDIQLLTSCYDTERNKVLRSHRDEAEAQAEEEEDKGDDALDYLAPYLIQIDATGDALTQYDALAVRSECLKDLKSRLIEKANRIQARFDKETAELQKRQDFYNDNKFQTQEEQEVYVTYCNEAMFRIHVLEQRLSAHKEEAPKKYEEVHNKLKNDPRISQWMKDLSV